LHAVNINDAIEKPKFITLLFLFRYVKITLYQQTELWKYFQRFATISEIDVLSSIISTFTHYFRNTGL